MQNNLLISESINWYKWKIRIDGVNSEYHHKVSLSTNWNDEIVYGGVLRINYRNPKCCLNNIYEFNKIKYHVIVSPLPKNYW